MKHKIKTYVNVEKEIVDKLTCDICGKEIKEGKLYYSVTTSHDDWGNDSIDSIEYKDICSDECLRNELENYIKFESDTKHISIDKEIFK